MAGYDRNVLATGVRTNVALAICLVCFSLIALRLWYLQILQGNYFRSKSENNRIRTIYVPPPRGLVYDREGKIIAKNRPAFDIDLIVEDAPNPKETLAKLASLLNLPPAQLQGQLGPQKKRRRFEPKLILRDVDRDTVARVLAHKYELPGVVVNVIPARDYLYGDLFSHVVGYLREINARQLDNPDFSGYRSGDLVGQYGLEAIWEWFLQGKRGLQRVIVNATGTKIGEASADSHPAVPGHNITVTLDVDLQRAAAEALGAQSGGVIALDPRTGEVLALVSQPSFDPNIFSQEISSETWKDLTTGREKRLNNRVVQGVYPPGSVFKIIMAVAGLAEGVISPNERVSCPGFYQVGRRTFHCHKKTGHGAVNLEEAIIQSCDVYFYTLGTRLGVDRIHEYATKFGLGGKSGLKLAEESTGLIPSQEWKRLAYKDPEQQKWFPGETPSVSIGQGAVSVTPLQIARALSALVNGGKLLTPYLVKSIRSDDGAFNDQDFGPEVSGTLGLDQAILDRVKNALVGVVHDPHGTAHRAQLDPAFHIKVGGKTGTAQVVALDKGTAEHLNDHAWFAGFAPDKNTEIVVVALVENGGHGGVTAAPIVQRVLDAYFRKKIPLLPVPPGLQRRAMPVPAPTPVIDTVISTPESNNASAD
jgi:penicillin-binding protein 2